MRSICCCSFGGERRKSGVAMLLGTGRNLRPVQSLGLGPGEPEHEIFRKARDVALDLLVQALGGDAVESGKLGIENDPLAAQDEDRAGDVLDRRLGFGTRWSWTAACRLQLLTCAW
jgi:hypothetical protein